MYNTSCCRLNTKMRVDIKFLKAVTKLLVLLILFVLLFLISSFLYSARYWKDIYIYSHPNITITRIPTISELNLTDYEIDYTTELTTELYDSTTDYSNSSYLIDDDFLPLHRVERDTDYDVPQDKNKEKLDYFFDYDYYQSNKKELNVETTTVNDVEVIKVITGADHIERSFNKSIEVSCHGNASSVGALVHPWIAAIFVKNASNEQFDYICDGAILSDRIILTAARCLLSGNNTLEVSNVLVISGKTTLLNTGSNERVYRIQNIKLHDNFTNQGEVQNDIATLRTDENIIFNNDVQTACLISKDMDTESVVDAVTTGWKLSGELTTVHFDAKTYGDCKDSKNASKNQFCASYGNEITTCPSYGGLNMVKLSNDQWFLNGIRSGDTTDRTLCLEKTLVYTDLKKYVDWIDV